MRKTSKEWKRVVSDYEGSGKSQEKFSKERGISVSSLRYHLGKERSRGERNQVTELVVSKESEVLAELEFPGGITLRVRSSC